MRSERTSWCTSGNTLGSRWPASEVSTHSGSCCWGTFCSRTAWESPDALRHARTFNHHLTVVVIFSRFSKPHTRTHGTHHSLSHTHREGRFRDMLALGPWEETGKNMQTTHRISLSVTHLQQWLWWRSALRLCGNMCTGRSLSCWLRPGSASSLSPPVWILPGLCCPSPSPSSPTSRQTLVLSPWLPCSLPPTPPPLLLLHSLPHHPPFPVRTRWLAGWCERRLQ